MNPLSLVFISAHLHNKRINYKNPLKIFGITGKKKIVNVCGRSEKRDLVKSP